VWYIAAAKSAGGGGVARYYVAYDRATGGGPCWQPGSVEDWRSEFFLFIIFFIKSFTKIIFHFEN
jgi:hypothetical protein